MLEGERQVKLDGMQEGGGGVKIKTCRKRMKEEKGKEEYKSM